MCVILSESSVHGVRVNCDFRSLQVEDAGLDVPLHLLAGSKRGVGVLAHCGVVADGACFVLELVPSPEASQV
jgi:hypothetical protein